jgi:hypothetical protein
MYLNSTQLAAAHRWRPLYEEAERHIGVPWLLMAALHYRETNFGAQTGRAGGVLQFDPPLTPAKVRQFGARFKLTNLTDPERDPRTAILCAAAFLQVNKGAGLTPDATEAECADAAWSYNGRAYGSWQASPYVSNDPQRGVTLHIRGTVPSLRNPAIRERIDRPDPRPGVLAVMHELRARLGEGRPAAVAPATPAATESTLLVAGPDGAFHAPSGPRFTLPYPVTIGLSGGKWHIRPATAAEVKGKK